MHCIIHPTKDNPQETPDCDLISRVEFDRLFEIIASAEPTVWFRIGWIRESPFQQSRFDQPPLERVRHEHVTSRCIFREV